MNVAPATYQSASALGTMTARGGQNAETGAGARPASATADPSPTNAFHYPIVGFTYDRETWKVVILYRDPETGKTTGQIPTEAALERYKLSQHLEKSAEERRETESKSAAAGATSSGATVTPLFSTGSSTTGATGHASASPSTKAGGTSTGATSTSPVNVVV